VISALLIVARVLCTLGSSAFTVFISRFITTADSHPGWRGPIVIGWAGMRGVVSLAAALSIPLYAAKDVPFPQRNLILFITFTVILVTLVVQGLTLPWVIKMVKLEDPDHYASEEEQDVELRKSLAAHSLAFLDKHCSGIMEENHALMQLRAKLETEQSLPNPEAELLQANFRKIFLMLLAEQRRYLLELNKKPETNEELIRRHQGLIDLEEEKIRVRYEHDPEEDTLVNQ